MDLSRDPKAVSHGKPKSQEAESRKPESQKPKAESRQGAPKAGKERRKPARSK
jgi:hypothetical protein